MAAPQGGGGGGQGGQDNSAAMLWIMIGIFVFAAGVWYFASEYLIFAYLKIKALEILALSAFTDKLDVVQEWISTIPPSQIGASDVAAVATVVGNYLKIPVMIIMLTCAAYIYSIDEVRKYTKTYDMKLFLQCERENWPQVNPIAAVDLLEHKITEGPWAMSMQPMEFAKKNGLLTEIVAPLLEGQLAKDQKVTVELDRGASNKYFSMQLGPLWPGLKKLPIHIRALFAIFSARAENDSEAAEKLLSQISRSSYSGKLDFTGVDTLLKKYGDTKLTRRVTARHAYVLTVMASMLELGRTSGVLASADFLWLKPVDRRLWYMLNNVGRWTAFTEVAGPFAHLLAEREIGRKLKAPMIEEASNALETAISEMVYQSDRDLEAERLGIQDS